MMSEAVAVCHLTTRNHRLKSNKTSHEKVKEGCDRLAVDIQPSGDRDDWKFVQDDAVRKAMHSKGDWVKQMRDIQEEFTRYKTLITIWSPGDLDVEESQYSTLKEQLELASGA